MTTADREEASHRARRGTRSIPAQKHRDARVLNGRLHRDAFSPPPANSASPFNTDRPFPNTFTPTPGAGKYQRKAEKLLWELETKLRGTKLSAANAVSSGFAEEGRFDGVVLDADIGFNTIDGELYANDNEMYMMSGALSADDNRCELGRACFRTKTGSALNESRVARKSGKKRGKRREESDFRSFDSGWYAPHEEGEDEAEKKRIRRKKRGEMPEALDIS
ncbi:hypothetical protein AC578_6968 [Pseudocercospora eumusae]|uniref:Uncharacterized protein n=1 Tax=Pseudocercospora eumusae TaxID=321146 RepID=A0A139H9F7_9PEZI|nr:hypothetical protein AC578_6968 [Pseudocercospora eumusae]